MTACSINASHLLDIQQAKSAFLQYITQYPELAVSALYSGYQHYTYEAWRNILDNHVAPTNYIQFVNRLNNRYDHSATAPSNSLLDYLRIHETTLKEYTVRALHSANTIPLAPLFSNDQFNYTRQESAPVNTVPFSSLLVRTSPTPYAQPSTALISPIGWILRLTTKKISNQKDFDTLPLIMVTIYGIALVSIASYALSVLLWTQFNLEALFFGFITAFTLFLAEVIISAPSLDTAQKRYGQSCIYRKTWQEVFQYPNEALFYHLGIASRYHLQNDAALKTNWLQITPSGMLLTQKWLTHPQTLNQYHEHYTKFTHTP